MLLLANGRPGAACPSSGVGSSGSDSEDPEAAVPCELLVQQHEALQQQRYSVLPVHDLSAAAKQQQAVQQARNCLEELQGILAEESVQCAGGDLAASSRGTPAGLELENKRPQHQPQERQPLAAAAASHSQPRPGT